MPPRKLLRCAVSLLAAPLLVATLMGGCGTFILNQTAERVGSINVVFVNNTEYRAIFSFGTWDGLDLDPPGPVQLRQLRLEPGTSSDAASLSCARNFAVGTEALIERAIDTDADDTPNFDPDAFDTVVRFSDQPADSDLAGVATVGTAAGQQRFLGVHYTCSDELILAFVEDPDAVGGFRIDYTLVVDDPDER